MAEQLSGGERKHIRRVKAAIRRDTGFVTDETGAIVRLREDYFSGQLQPDQETLLRQWWRIRSDFRSSGDQAALREKTDEFNKSMDEKDSTLGGGFYSALRFITDEFSRTG